MKRLLLLIMTLCLALTMLSCGSGTSDGAEETDAEPRTLGEFIAADFRAAVRQDPSVSLSALAEKLLERTSDLFMGGTMPMEPGYFMGIDAEEVTGFAEAVQFGPMIGSIPFMGYVFRMDADADKEAFMKMLSDHADLGWNICTRADSLIVRSDGDYILMVMCRESDEE